MASKFSQKTGMLMAHACPKSTVNSYVTQPRKPPKADTSMSRRSTTLELSLPRFGKPRDSLPRPKRRKRSLKLLSCKKNTNWYIYVYQDPAINWYKKPVSMKKSLFCTALESLSGLCLLHLQSPLWASWRTTLPLNSSSEARFPTQNVRVSTWCEPP